MLELSTNPSMHAFMTWMMDEFTIGSEVGELDATADYRKGMNDILLMQLDFLGLELRRSLTVLQPEPETEDETE